MDRLGIGGGGGGGDGGGGGGGAVDGTVKCNRPCSQFLVNIAFGIIPVPDIAAFAVPQVKKLDAGGKQWIFKICGW